MYRNLVIQHISSRLRVCLELGSQVLEGHPVHPLHHRVLLQVWGQASHLEECLEVLVLEANRHQEPHRVHPEARLGEGRPLQFHTQVLLHMVGAPGSLVVPRVHRLVSSLPPRRLRHQEAVDRTRQEVARPRPLLHRAHRVLSLESHRRQQSLVDRVGPQSHRKEAREEK